MLGAPHSLTERCYTRSEASKYSLGVGRFIFWAGKQLPAGFRRTQSPQGVACDRARSFGCQAELK